MAIVVVLLGTCTGFAQNVRLHGRVLDSRTSEPIAKAFVSIRERRIETATNENGEFELLEIQPGSIELYVTTVGYSLIRKKIDIAPGIPVEVELLLGPDVIRRSDEVSVTTAPFVTPEPATISDQTLTQEELKNLTSVFIDDPLRSVQVLPGVATGDDFTAEFAVRGAGFRSIGFNMDGVLLASPFHSVSDVSDGGSLSVFNSEVIESVTLLTGAFPAKYGDRTAGELVVETRDGSRSRFTNSGTASASGLAWTSEGPVGSSRKASWIGSARKSYLDYLINRLSTDPASAQLLFGFYDGFGKITWDPNDHHQVRISGNFGNSRADQHRRLSNLGVNTVLYGDRRTRIGQTAWRWIPSSRVLVDSALSYTSSYGNNVNRDNQLLFNSNQKQTAVKQDASFQIASWNRIEAGYFARRLGETALRRRSTGTILGFQTSDTFASSAWQPGGYAQNTVTVLDSRVALTYAVRFDRFSTTGETVWMPRASAALSPFKGNRITFGYGRYSQFPEFMDLYGEFGNPSLHAERATHYVFGIEQLINEKTRIRVEGYDREDRSGIYSINSEFRLMNGIAVIPPRGALLKNTLRGYGRGLEIFLQRRSTNKLLGWVSYAYSHARLRDGASGVRFDSDFDQRHTFNAYGSYRWTSNLNVSMKYRYGSNFPLAGFFKKQNGAILLSDQRNQLRLPAYSRVDLRVNRAFHFDRFQVTLFGELLNVLSSKNRRYTADFDTINGRVSVHQNELLPRIPIAGLRIDF